MNDKYKVQFSDRDLRSLLTDLHPLQKPDKSAKWYMEALIEYALMPSLDSLALSPEEATLIVGIFNGGGITPLQIQTIDRDIAGAIVFEELDKAYGIDAQALVQKLKGYGYCQRLALCDAVNRFWEVEARHIPDTLQRLKEVGLVRC